MVPVAQFSLTGGPWLDAILSLPRGGWIAAGYASGLITHGAQLAPPGCLRLRALPVLASEGEWRLVAEKPQRVTVRFVPRLPGFLPDFEPSIDCVAGCAPFIDPAPLDLRFEPEPQRALAYPSTGLVVIDPTFWAAIPTVAGRLGILGHELGHLLGAACQRCADAYAGRYLRALGLSPRDAIQTFDSTVETRSNAALALAEGGL